MRFPFHISGSEVPDGIVTISPDGLIALVLFPPTYSSNDGGPNDRAADNGPAHENTFAAGALPVDLAEERKTMTRQGQIRRQGGDEGQPRNVLTALVLQSGGFGEGGRAAERVPVGLSSFRSCHDEGAGLCCLQPRRTKPPHYRASLFDVRGRARSHGVAASPRFRSKPGAAIGKLNEMLRENEPEMPEINTDKVCFVVTKSRELLSEDVGAERDDSNPTDDGFAVVLTDAGDRPARRELVEFIEGLDAGERDALVALVWIGRGDFEGSDWRAALKLARERREVDIAKYLLGIPLLPDYLEDALSAFDQSCRGFEEREEPGI